LEIREELPYVLVLEPLHEAFDLIGGLVDVSRDRFVLLISQLARTAANGLGDGAESFRCAIFLTLDAVVCAFADSIEEAVAGAVGSIGAR
jgi:hypothetical protein